MIVLVMVDGSVVSLHRGQFLAWLKDRMAYVEVLVVTIEVAVLVATVTTIVDVDPLRVTVWRGTGYFEAQND